MAAYPAISVIATTLLRVLANSLPAGEFAGAEFKLFRTQDFQDPGARLSLGLSVYLHRIEFNVNRRNQPPRVDAEGRKFRPSAAVDLHFLITAWGPTAERQMDLLACAIRTLQDTPQLPAGVLNRFAGDRALDVFADNEAVELVGENLAAQDFVNLWGNTLANQQPSVSYLARQVLIDSETPILEGAAVQTRKFDVRKPQSSA